MPYRLQRDTAFSWLLAAAPIPTGLVMATFSERFTSRAWRFAGSIPGGYSMWAGVLLACGVLMCAAMALNVPRHTRHRDGLVIGGMMIIGAWWATLGGMFLYAAIVDPLANPLGVVVWWFVAAIYFVWSHFERRRL